MNIFFLHPNPRRCARWHCDKHVVKMILESCQLLYTVHWVVCKGIEPDYIHCAPKRGYKPTHTKHPCVLWLLESIENYRWLVKLTGYLIEEYHHRYNDKYHACEHHLEWLSIVEPNLPCIGFTQPRCAMPDIYKRNNSVVAYRLYYKHEKSHITVYTKRHRPHFLN